MRLATATALILLLAGPVSAQSTDALLGAWQLERDTPRGAVQVPFTFAEKGDSIVLYVGEGEQRTAMGGVDFDGTTVTFGVDLRAVMQQAMAGQRGGQRGGQGAGAAGRAGQRAGGPPQGARQGAGGRGAGGQADAAPPRFSGTLEGATITGAVTTPRGEQEFILRRVQSG